MFHKLLVKRLFIVEYLSNKLRILLRSQRLGSRMMGNDLVRLCRQPSLTEPSKDRAMGNPHLIFYTDYEIVSHFNLVIQSLLNWFSGAGNFAKVKGLAHLLRSSCILTLANKHKKSKNWVYTVYGSEVTVLNNTNITRLINRSSILNHFSGFNLRSYSSSMDSYEFSAMICRFHKLNNRIKFFEVCSVTRCPEL